MSTPQEILTVHIRALLFRHFEVSPATSKISSWTEPLILDPSLQTGVLESWVASWVESWVAGMLRCPRHLPLPPSAMDGRQALAPCGGMHSGPPCYAGSLGTSVGQESWEGGGKPQLLRANVPAGGGAGGGGWWTTMDCGHTSSRRPSPQQSRAEQAAERKVTGQLVHPHPHPGS